MKKVPVYYLYSRQKLCYQNESDFHSRKNPLSLVTDKGFMFPFYSPTMQCLRRCTDFKRISKWWAREKSSQDLQIYIHIRTSETWNCVDWRHLSAELKPCIYFPNLSSLLPFPSFPSFPLLSLSHFSSFVPFLFPLPPFLWTLFLTFSQLSFLMPSYYPFLSLSAPFSPFLIYFCYFILFFSFHFQCACFLFVCFVCYVLNPEWPQTSSQFLRIPSGNSTQFSLPLINLYFCKRA